jgi:hypothetical protein
MIRWREIGLIALLFCGLILFTIYGPGQANTETSGRRGSTHSSGDEGALALQRWLATLGYAPSNLEYSTWHIPKDTQALLLIDPTEKPILDAEAQEIVRWVRDGGTLIAVDERPQLILSPNRLWNLFQATTTVSDTKAITPAERATPAQPVLSTPPVTSVPVDTAASISLKDPGYVTLLQTRFGPTLIGRQEGRGYVYLGVSAYPFTNVGLREPGSGALVLNLLARVPRGAKIVFDEYHHGFTQAASAAPSLRQIALSHWWGWAAVYAVAVAGLYIVLTGRRFGRPVPLRRDITRRSSAEYVQSLAQLLQRAGKRQPIARHFHDGLKRRLARRHGLVPPTDDEAFLHSLLNSGDITKEQAQTLRKLLNEMLRPGLSDAELVHLVQAADGVAQKIGHVR